MEKRNYLIFLLVIIISFSCQTDEEFNSLVDGDGNEYNPGLDVPDRGGDDDDPNIGGGPISGGDGPTSPTNLNCSDYEANIYWNGDEHLDGTHSGHDVVLLDVTGTTWPSETTYKWIIKRQDNTSQTYAHSTEIPRIIEASWENPITEITIIARYGNCEASGTIVPSTPFPFEGGTSKVGGHFLDKIKIKGYRY